MALINEPRETGLGPPLSMPISSETTPAADDVVAFARDQNVQLVDLNSPIYPALGSTLRSPPGSSARGY